MSAASPHNPVMLDEVLAHLNPQAGKCYVDGTFGAGGYSRAILAHAACTLIAMDRDPNVAEHRRALEEDFQDRFTFIQGRFGEMAELLKARDIQQVDGIVLDIGVSSMQLDEGGRGFSFRLDGPLDMRMSGEGDSAADVVNALEEGALADIIYRYGEERHSRRIAREIARVRAEKPIETTSELASLIHRVMPPKKQGIDPATRTFQALRIYVNDELGELERALDAANQLLAPGGRLVVVSFHSLEDRIVKHHIQRYSGQTGGGSRHMPLPESEAPILLKRLSKGAVKATDAEAKANPRARSAKLRAAERTEVPYVRMA